MPQQAGDIIASTTETKPENPRAEEQAGRSANGVKTTALSRARSELHQGLILLTEGYIENQIAAERFRILRAKIERLNLAQRRYKVLAVTSAVPSEGKSVLAVNLARALSIDPLGKTLLIDCDLRNPPCSGSFARRGNRD